MEEMLYLFGFGVGLLVLIGSIFGVIAFVALGKTRDEIKEINKRLDFLSRKITSFDLPTPKLEKSDIRVEVTLPAEKPPEKQPPPISQPLGDIPQGIAIFDEPSSPADKKTSRIEVNVPPVAPMSEKAEKESQWWENFEKNVGQRWMTWLGAFVLFLSAGFFVKYAFDNQWIGPTARIVMGLVAGIVCIIVGDRFLRKEMRALGQGLLGLGMAVLYVSIFSGHALYDLYPQTITFAMLVSVTMAGMALAVLHNAIGIAILAVIGGFLTPLMVSTGKDARDALFLYVTILDLGVLGVAFFKKYRALDIIAFLGTCTLFLGWFSTFYRSKMVLPVMLWVGMFFLIFLILPFVYHLRKRESIPVERFVMAMANAAWAFLWAYALLHYEYPFTLGFVALAMGGAYISLGVFTRKRVSGDSRALLGFVTLAVAFLTAAIPLQLRLSGITLAWAIEAPVLLYLGYRYTYRPVRIFAAIIMVMSVGRLFLEHFPLHKALFIPVINIHFAGAMCVPVAMILFAYVAHRFSKQGTSFDKTIGDIAALAAGFLVLIICHNEMGSYIKYTTTLSFYKSAVICVWLIGSAGFVYAGRRLNKDALHISGFVALVYALILGAAAFDAKFPEMSLIFLNRRFLLTLTGIVGLFAFAKMQMILPESFCKAGKPAAAVMAWMGVFGLLILLSVETYGYLRQTIQDYSQNRYASQMALSIVWGLYAVVALIVGFAKRIRPLRFGALALFGVTTLKLILFDMSMVKQIYRIVTFVALGLLMIGASYLYHIVEKKLVQPESGESK